MSSFSQCVVVTEADSKGIIEVYENNSSLTHSLSLQVHVAAVSIQTVTT